MIRTTMIALIGVLILAQVPSIAVSARVKIGQPKQDMRISPYLFGSFIELLDDLVPGMRAEMLNDRGFDGVLPCANWCYYNGLPNICDRKWEVNDTWTYDTTNTFNGTRSVKLVPRKGHPASLTQSGLAVQKGMRYRFSGHFAWGRSAPRWQVILKTRLPDGKWMQLASASVPPLYLNWRGSGCVLTSSGTADNAVFELKVTGGTPLWADKLSLVPANNVEGWREDVVNAIREAKPGIIRWGGSACDPGGYKWKDGIGDPDSRTPFPNKVWGRIDSNDVGIDEFLQFCELVKAEPLVCISFGDGAESARDLVEYCNGGADTKWGSKRAANGHPKPYGVRFWQIGNELGDEKYANGCAEFCKAIKQADPKAVILASYPSKLLLEKAGNLLDYVCPHHYTPDLNACETSLSDVRQMLATSPGCGEIKVGITEWNITAGSFGLQRSSLLTLDAALANGCYLNLLLRHADLAKIACRSNMTNSMCAGMIQTNPAGLYKTPSYYVMKLYANHVKHVYVPTEGAPKGVDSVASASDDGRSLCVLAVNRNKEPVELSFDLGSYSGFGITSAEVVRDTQDTRQTEVVNGWSRPDRIRGTKLETNSDSVVLPALSASAVEFAKR